LKWASIIGAIGVGIMVAGIAITSLLPGARGSDNWRMLGSTLGFYVVTCGGGLVIGALVGLARHYSPRNQRHDGES